MPPRYSALKIDGERAYDLAREGAEVELDARPVEIHRLELIETPDADHAVLVAECGKGTYVRAIARDMGRALGCLGHVSALRRTAVGSFEESHAVGIDALQAPAIPESALLPVAAGLASVPALNLSRGDAARLARGQSVLLRGRDAPIMSGPVAVFTHGTLVAIADIEKGEVQPRRIFNFGQPHAPTGQVTR